MAIRKKADRFVLEFQQRGVRVFRRLPPGVTKAQAQEYETKLRREIFDGELGKREDLTLPAAIGLWLQNNRRKNQRQAESEARQWEPFVAGRYLREAPEVAQEAVAEWRISRRPQSRGIVTRIQGNGWNGTASADPSPATVNRRLALLKAVCKHAWRQGLIEQNLSGRIPLLREDNKREVYLTRAEVTRLTTKSSSVEFKAAIMLLAFTGLRVSELLGLAPGDWTRDSLSVRQSKTGKPRRVPVPSSARAYLRALPLGMSYWQLRNEFDAAKIKAGLPHVRIHDLRHACASWLINAGVDLYTVGKILGHSGPQSTARYAHLSTQTLEKAMRRLK